MVTDVVLEQLSAAYDGKTVIENLTGRIPAGQVTCLEGKSGAGKTTLLRVILGRLKPAGGCISGNGMRFSAVFQEDRLLENLTAAANVRFVTGDSRSDAEISLTLSELGLESASDKPVREYSGGMKRRVAIARALLAEHDCLILDEPFKGLDPDTRERVAGVIRAREAGRTVILVTHDGEEARLMGAEHFIRIG